MASAAGSVAAASATTTTASTRCRRRRVAVLLHRGASAHTLVPIRPRWRGERRSLRTLPGTSLRPPHVCDATTDGDGDGEVGEVGANDDANDASSSSSSSIADAPSRAAASAAVRALADRVLPNGASVNDRDDETGETALVVASERGDLDDVRALLAVGADVAIASFSGWTALHGAAENGSIACVKALIDAGADVNAVTSSTGKSVLDIARQYGRADAEEVLASYGAAFAVTRRMDKQSDEEPDADYEVLDDDDDDDDESDTALDALEALVRRAREDPSYAPTVADIENLNAFPFDPFQSEAAEALIRGDCVVVSAPTGSGKTLVGEVAIVNALLRGQKAIYTTPLKALSNQKLREFQKIFGPRRVGLKTGDVEINAADADVVVMTTEILRNMLYPSAGAEDAGGGGVTVDVPSSAVVIGEDAGRADGRLEGVGVVILDEVHYLSDASRGTVWEETIIYLPSAVQLLCLSATVGNPDDLAGWIEDVHCRGGTQCEVVQSDYRPVPLTWHFSMKPGRMYPGLGPLLNRAGTRLHHELFPFTKEGAREWANANGGDGYGSYGNSFDDRYGVGDDDDGYYEGGFFRRNNNDRGRGRGGGGGRGRRGSGGGGGGGRRFPPPPPSPATDKQQRRRLVPHVETTVGQLVAGNMLPAVWFVFSRKGCDQAAEYLCRCGAKLVTPAEEREIAATLDAFARQNPDAIRDDAIEPLLLGIASHHAGLLPGWKGLVEGLFQRGLLKVVFATETLAAGVNMPARCSVLSALSKRGDAGPRMLTSNEFMQMCGRAGRRGFDTIGHVVACQSPFEGPEEAFDLVTSPPDNLRSQFSISYGMVLNLVRAGRPLPMVRSIVEQSFGNYLGGKAKREQTKELRRLKQQADALREQIEMGESIVPREEWRRYVKLEERLKEERRLMKIISRQSWDMKAEMARAAIRDFLEIDEGIALALVELDDVAEDGRVIRPGRNLPPSFSRGARPKSKTIGLMPDGSWSVEDPDAAEDDVADGEDDVASADSSNAVTPRTADAADAVAAFDDADSDESPHATPSSSSSTSSAFSRPRGRVALVAVVDAIAADSDGVGDFIGVDRDGAWYRFGAERARRVLNEPLVLAADVDAWPPRAPPVRSSIAWRRVGDGLWRAEGNADAIAAAAAAGVPRADDDSNSDDDESERPSEIAASVAAADDDDASFGLDETLRFLTEQRAKVAATRREIDEMKNVAELRRAVKLNNRKREKLSTLDKRISRLEKRVGEYAAAGWAEFLRVVDILVEMGALVDPIPEEELAREAEQAEMEAAAKAKAAEDDAESSKPKDPVAASAFGDDFWEPDAPFSLSALDDAHDLARGVDVNAELAERAAAFAKKKKDAAVARRRRETRRKMRWPSDDDDDARERGDGSSREPSSSSRVDTLTLTPLGEVCATLRGENELWLGVALSDACVADLDEYQLAGVFGAICADANRPASSSYDPSAKLRAALRNLEPIAAGVMTVQYEAGMSSSVTLSDGVAALCEAWASGATWDQIRRDTNLDEGDIARVFRRTAELLAQAPRTRELPESVRKRAKAAEKLVLRPPITDLS